MRVAFTARGRRYSGALVATAEAMAFATVFAQVLDSVDSPVQLAAYGAGVRAGTLAGLAIDQRITRLRPAELATSDHEVASTMPCRGSDSPAVSRF